MLFKIIKTLIGRSQKMEIKKQISLNQTKGMDPKTVRIQSKV